MNKHLIDYLPPVLQRVLEFRAVNASCEPEISAAWDALALVMADQFIDTAEVSGVAMWEHELGLFPKDGDSLDVRKARIKALWNRELPYTLPWLKKWLTGLCGPSGHEETISDYTINIQLDTAVLPNTEELAREILDMLLDVRPSNMRIIMTAFSQSYGSVTCSAYTEASRDIEVWPRLVTELESRADANTSGMSEYLANFDLYPLEV